MLTTINILYHTVYSIKCDIMNKNDSLMIVLYQKVGRILYYAIEKFLFKLE